MSRQRRILVAIDELPQDFWENWNDMVQVQFVRTGTQAYQMLKQQAFHLAFVDLYLTGMDGLELLRRIKTETLCEHVVLTSSVPSFSYAQQGILYGAAAYLIRPLQENEVGEVLKRTLSTVLHPGDAVQDAALFLVDKLRQENVLEVLNYAVENLLPEEANMIAGSSQVRVFWLEIVNQCFLRYPWLKRYHRPEEFTSIDYVHDSDGELLMNLCRRRIFDLHRAMISLFPVSADSVLEEIEIALLQRVDSNQQQKEIAEQFYMASSTLSIHFRKQFGISYRDYVTRLKIRRGEYLLRYTDIPSEELAGRLGYKDKAHFSKLFLEYTGMPLQKFGKQKWSDYQI